MRSIIRHERPPDRGSPNSIAHMRPIPRISRTTSNSSTSGAVSSSSRLPSLSLRATSSCSSSSCSVASPAAIASSFGANVEPCENAFSIESKTASCTARDMSSAPTGT